MPRRARPPPPEPSAKTAAMAEPMSAKEGRGLEIAPRKGAPLGGARRARQFAEVPFPAVSLELPRGLSPEGERALAMALARLGSSKAANTQRAYRADWSIWCHAAAVMGLAPLPADSTGLAAFVSWLRDHRGASPATIRRRLAGVAWVHRLAGHPVDLRHPLILGAVRGVAEEAGPQRQASALMLADLQLMLRDSGRDLSSLRNRAMLLLCWAGALRRSELVSLRVDPPEWGDAPWSHLLPRDGGLVICLVRSKGERERPVEIGIPRGARPETCPVLAVEAWVRAAQRRQGPLFVPISPKGLPEERPLSGEAVRKIVRQMASLAGISGTGLETISAHSLRAGFITEAYRQGIDDESIMQHSRHKDLRTMRRYVRRARIISGSLAGKIGL